MRLTIVAIALATLYFGRPSEVWAHDHEHDCFSGTAVCGWVGETTEMATGTGCSGDCDITRYQGYNCSDGSSASTCSFSSDAARCGPPNDQCVCGATGDCRAQFSGCAPDPDGPCGNQTFREVCDGLDNDGDGAIDEIAYCTEGDYDFRGHITRVGSDGNPFFTCDGGTPTDPGARPGGAIFVGWQILADAGIVSEDSSSFGAYCATQGGTLQQVCSPAGAIINNTNAIMVCRNHADAACLNDTDSSGNMCSDEQRCACWEREMSDCLGDSTSISPGVAQAVVNTYACSSGDPEPVGSNLCSWVCVGGSFSGWLA